MFKPEQWRVFGGTAELENTDMKVDHVEMEIVVRDTASRDGSNAEKPFLFTDLQFQPGNQKTGWVPNTKEMLDRIEFNVDERRKYIDASGNLNPFFVFDGPQPTQYTSEQLNHTRVFNLFGRGHEVITLPNDLPEEEFWQLSLIEEPVEILSTGVNFTIIPKDDYDLFRIATDVGELLPVEEHVYKVAEGEDGFIDHPLNYRYSREFWFRGGSAGDVLVIDSERLRATRNGVKVSTKGVRRITVGNDVINITQNRFHMIPRGSVRFRVEFYKRDTTTGRLEDVGIGFKGIAEFKQWTYGSERL